MASAMPDLPTAEHYHLMIDDKLYCVVNRGTCVYLPGSAPDESRTSNHMVTSPTCYHYATEAQNSEVVSENKKVRGNWKIRLMKA